MPLAIGQQAMTQQSVGTQLEQALAVGTQNAAKGAQTSIGSQAAKTAQGFDMLFEDGYVGGGSQNAIGDQAAPAGAQNAVGKQQ